MPTAACTRTENHQTFVSGLRLGLVLIRRTSSASSKDLSLIAVSEIGYSLQIETCQLSQCTPSPSNE